MITTINNLPQNMVGFRATGKVTANDFKHTVIPKVEAFIETREFLNYLLVLDTSIKNFTAGAWFQDVWLGLKDITKWNRSAIITDKENIQSFTDIFDKLMIGEFRAFSKDQYDAAVAWVSGK